jgi:hypothetical protein
MVNTAAAHKASCAACAEICAACAESCATGRHRGLRCHLPRLRGILPQDGRRRRGSLTDRHWAARGLRK